MIFIKYYKYNLINIKYIIFYLGHTRIKKGDKSYNIALFRLL